MVAGLICTSEAAIRFGNCPFLTENQLASANYNNEMLWGRLSILTVQLGMFFIWMLFFGGFIFAAAVFALYTKGRKI